MSRTPVISQPPVLYPLKEAQRVAGIGPSKIYKLIADGTLDARKTIDNAYGRTLITHTSLMRYIESLPSFVPGGLPVGRQRNEQNAARVKAACGRDKQAKVRRMVPR